MYVLWCQYMRNWSTYFHPTFVCNVRWCHSNVMIVDTNRKTFSARREIKVGNWIFLFWKLFYSLLSSALRLSFMTHEFMDIPCIFAFWKKGNLNFNFYSHFFFVMKWKMTTFSIAQNNGSILQFVDWNNFPQIFVQSENLLHFILCQFKFVGFQIVQ